MGQQAKKPKTCNTAQDVAGQDVAGANQRIAERMRELAERRAAIDRDLVTAALHKRAAGTAPTVRERNALAKHSRIHDEELFWRACRNLPQAHLRILSGRHPRQFIDQSQRYGLSLGGKTWDLAALVLDVFTLLAEIAPWWGQWKGLPGDDAALLVGPNTPAMERVRIARAKLLELELKERLQEVLPRGALRDRLTEMASYLREAGARIGREFGRPAQQILDDAVHNFERLIRTSTEVAHEPGKAKTLPVNRRQSARAG